jgi:hypothetical protein
VKDTIANGLKLLFNEKAFPLSFNYLKDSKFDISGVDILEDGPDSHLLDNVVTDFSDKKKTITIIYDQKDALIVFAIFYIRIINLPDNDATIVIGNNS